MVKLKLIENDYAILRRFSGRSSFPAFIAVTIRRMLLDLRIHEWGKWRPSADAKRLGDAAVELEVLLHRDHRSLAEAVPIVAASFSLTPGAVERLAERLPARPPRPRAVDLEHVDAEVHLPGEAIETRAFEDDRLAAAHRTAVILRETFDHLPHEDRCILNLRFFSGLTVPDIARIVGIHQKLLYRRIDRHLRISRARLEAAGIGADDIQHVLERLPEDFSAFMRAQSSSSPHATAENAESER
jgi:RNA polymerase sigma factor for flagellar operon FliA